MTVPQITDAPPTLVPPNEKSVKETTETLWKIYGAINEWIRFADAKAGAVLAANGVLVGATITALQGSSGFLHAHRFTCAFVVLGLLCVVISTFFCLRCIQPSLSLKADPGNSLVYFGHIAGKYKVNSRVYTDALHNKLHSPVDAMHEIGDQVWAVSQVANSKNLKIMRGVLFLGCGLVSGLLGCAAAVWGN